MFEPIQAFENLKEYYLRYIETAFRIASPELQKNRRDLIKKIGNLSTEILLEPMPKYESSGLKLGESGLNLNGFTEDDEKAFVQLALAGLFEKESKSSNVSKFALYEHQLEMLRRGVQSGHPGIVTSGTGSGKTCRSFNHIRNGG